ncbi:MAG: FHA domain-containing protein [Candidatus Omnitrophica bacterium]|nr:FHA domain-containing protein [Candidatus Omnitrophota bacterium]
MDDSNLYSTMRIKGDSLDVFKKEKLRVDKDSVDIGKKGGAFFVIIAGIEVGRIIIIDKPIMTIGRELGVDIVIPELHISRRHAQVTSQGKQIIIVDLNSTNGTFVNNQRIDKLLLKDGDEVRVGEVIMKFFQEDLDAGCIGLTDNQETPSEYYHRVYKECEAYFGERTKQFLDRQITAHLGKTPQSISPTDREELAKWIRISGSLFLEGERAKELSIKIINL